MERTTDALRRIAGELEALGKNETAQVLRYAAQQIERQQEEIATASGLISHITTERDQARARSKEMERQAEAFAGKLYDTTVQMASERRRAEKAEAALETSRHAREVGSPDPSCCGANDHPVFVYPCVLQKGHAGPHDNGSGDPWGPKAAHPATEERNAARVIEAARQLDAFVDFSESNLDADGNWVSGPPDDPLPMDRAWLALGVALRDLGPGPSAPSGVYAECSVCGSGEKCAIPWPASPSPSPGSETPSGQRVALLDNGRGQLVYAPTEEQGASADAFIRERLVKAEGK